jgi:hypothetical protein
MNYSIKYVAAIAAMLCFKIGVGIAGTSCNNSLKSPQIYEQASRHAVALNKKLNALHVKVALISRVGSDLSKYNMHYSHTGFAIKDYPGRKGQWTVIHLLNSCGTSKSSIHAQGLMNFFMDDLYNMDYQITVLAPTLQDQLYKNLKTPLVNKMHNDHYNMLAYPFSTRYQNSNQWVLEFLEAAQTGKNSRQVIQKTLMAKGYQPSIIPVSGLSKLGASVFKANISFDDHPNKEKNTNHYSVVTVDSIVAYLNAQGKVTANKEQRG